jgi:hypothetical protein
MKEGGRMGGEGEDGGEDYGLGGDDFLDTPFFALFRVIAGKGICGETVSCAM